LRRARVHGPGVVRFRDELAVSHRGRRQQRVIARRLAHGQQPSKREVLVDSVELEPKQTLAVRP
ncbi:MAG: hypothetical protein LC777_05405, partial [Actinobacteria bacterium]|nr:hypothetical protein [Actinomycetota bacterium]